MAETFISVAFISIVSLIELVLFNITKQTTQFKCAFSLFLTEVSDSYVNTLKSLSELLKEAGNSFQHFSQSYTLKDECCHCLTTDATIMVSYRFPIIG